MADFKLEAGLQNKPHVLIVDDDKRIRDLVARYLLNNDFIVMVAENAAHARKLLQKFIFDALVVDVMMPGEGGLNLTRYIREAYDYPVLLLTAMGETQDKIAGLESGADDYLAKPFEPKELVLRLKAIIRRTGDRNATPSLQSFKIGEWVFNPDREEFYHVDNSDNILNITEAELVLIKALAERNGVAVSRDILARICNVDVDSRSLDVQVTRLRRKIETDTRNPRYLQTVRGKGYMLKTEAV